MPRFFDKVRMSAKNRGRDAPEKRQVFGSAPCSSNPNSLYICGDQRPLHALIWKTDAK